MKMIKLLITYISYLKHRALNFYRLNQLVYRGVKFTNIGTVVIEGNIIVGDNVCIGSNVVLKGDVTISDETFITNSLLTVESNASNMIPYPNDRTKVCHNRAGNGYCALCTKSWT